MDSNFEGVLGNYRSKVIRACKASIDANACGTRMDHNRADAAEQQEEEAYAELVAAVDALEKRALRSDYLDAALRAVRATMDRLLNGGA